MTNRRASRMERRVRNQARGLLLVSVALLLACTTMTALFGWSLGRTVVDKFIFAMGLAAADLGGAFLIATCGTFSAGNEKRAACLALFAAGLCCVLTLTGIIGFQSESREGLAQSRERAVRIVDSYVNWARDTTVEAVQKDKSKGAVALATGIETVGKVVRDQIGMLQTGDVVPLADGQATTISRIIGISEARTRSWSISLTSAALLFRTPTCCSAAMGQMLWLDTRLVADGYRPRGSAPLRPRATTACASHALRDFPLRETP
jgi:hypothetical protein